LIFDYDYPYINSCWNKMELHADQDPSMWRYLPILPVHEKPVRAGMLVGGTPLIEYADLARSYSLEKLWIKDDSRLPSASLKDRASELAIQHAGELGFETLIAASTGNAGASLACLAAYHGNRAIIVAPADAPAAKLVQIRQYGAQLLAVRDNYDRAFDLAFELSKRKGLYCRNTGINPVLVEGKKTVALEMAEQLDWEPPDYVLVSVGDGCIISGVYRGFHDLSKLGWIDRIPKLVAVKAEGSAAVVNRLDYEGDLRAVEANTVADSISVNLPRDGEKARQSIQDSKGFGIVVSDLEILEAQRELAENFGLFVEPAAAAVLAGLENASRQNLIPEESRVILLVTGSGLKDIPQAQQSLPPMKSLAADIEILEQVLEV